MNCLNNLETELLAYLQMLMWMIDVHLNAVYLDLNFTIIPEHLNLYSNLR